MNCPNCGRRRGIYEWDEQEGVYVCPNCNTYFIPPAYDGDEAVILDEDDLADAIECDDDDYDDDENEESIEYVRPGCVNCSKWDDYYGCHDGLRKGDWCKHPDFY